MHGVAVQLSRGQVALIDEADVELVARCKWHAVIHPHGWYAGAYQRGNRRLYMHRLLMGLDSRDARVVDHIDHDGLNNRRENLRVCTPAENARNHRNVKSYTGRIGVFATSTGFIARIRKDGKPYYLGFFKSSKDACIAYDAAALVLHGDFATLNDESSRSA